MGKLCGLTLNPEKGGLKGPMAWPRVDGGTPCHGRGSPSPVSSHMCFPSWAVREGQQEAWGQAGVKGAQASATCRETLS